MSPRVLLAALLAIGACTPHEVTREPKPPVSLGDYRGASSDAAAPELWWRDFGDPRLSRLVERGLRENLQIRAAWARLSQARALGRQVAAARWPEIEAGATAWRQRFRSPFADVPDLPGNLPDFFTLNQFSWSVSAAYEVDLWNRLSTQATAAALDFEATRADVETLALTMAAEIAEAYYDLVFQRERLMILTEQVEINETFLDLIKLRFQQGLATSLDIYQQEQQLIATRAQLPLAEGTLDVVTQRLAALLGEPASEAQEVPRAELPDLPPLPGAGIPAHLLDRRPDVRAAMLRVEAADHRVASAVADRLPALRLSANIGAQGARLPILIQSPIWALLSSITQPLFDAGRRRAEVARTEAVVEELLYLYGQTLLDAVVEVESALAQERQQALYIAELERQVEAAEAALGEARVRYREGLSDFLHVLTSLQALQGSELGLLEARRQAISTRIQLCRALGGSWTRDLEPAGDEGEG